VTGARVPYAGRMGLIVLLIAVGLILIALETVLPGLIAGTLGFFSICAAIALAYMDYGFRTGNAVLIVVALLLGIGTILWVKFFPDSPMARVFVSNRQIGNVGAEKPELLGCTGFAITSLRPAGTAEINGKRVDVVSEGTYIEKGQEIRVIGIEGMRVVVRLRD
jgi:membrane-bound serine protease (ClpP class)